MKKLVILSAALVAGLALSACADQQAASRGPGTYESKSMSVDSYGTRYDRDNKTVIKVDEDGNRYEEVTSESSKDPKGLFNKKHKKYKKVIKKDANGNVIENSTTIKTNK